MKIGRALVVAVVFLCAPAAQAAGPVEITAEGSLAWDQANSQYIAEGKARAVQGGMTLAADKMVAHYREAGGKAAEIKTLEATGRVALTNDAQTVSGGKLVYQVAEQSAVLSGPPLRLKDTATTVTATDRFEYWMKEGKLIAVGNATVVYGTDRITSDRITAWFDEDPKTKARTLTRAEAIGNVIIETDAEKATGDKGFYNRKNNKAELVGNVVILRGPNRLEGTRAEVDLLTRVSRIFGASGENGRVKGLFFPGSTDSKAEPKAATP